MNPLILALLLSTAGISVPISDPVITHFTGESRPGTASFVDLSWRIAADAAPEGSFVRLYRFEGDSALPVGTYPLDRTTASVVVNPEAEQARFRLDLETMTGEVIGSVAAAAPIARRSGRVQLTAADIPYDGGGKAVLSWKLVAIPPADRIAVYRKGKADPAWVLAGEAAGDVAEFIAEGLADGEPVHFMARVYAGGKVWESPPREVVTHAAWFDWRKINLLVIALIVIFAVNWYALRRGGAPMFIRRIAGLSAVEEAVGRATEMGRSVLFVPGIQDLDDVQTIAGLTILGSVARKTAEYETKLDVPVSRSLVMSNGREVVKESYLSVGRPDFYHDDIVHYVTDEQFGYVAAVDGIMVRERPAACFYMGAFFAESLILAETGNHVGAIQIAGTAMPTQLPFFVAACDYTLIGEELFAASAYLSGDKQQIASLRGQDVGKLIAMAAILIGSVLVTLQGLTAAGGFWSRAADGFTRLFALNF